MGKRSKQEMLLALILVLVALISFFALAQFFSNPETFKGTISALDDKKNTVAKLSAISIGAASAIDLIPGDAGSSVSKALVDLGGYFVLLFAAIYLEKLLISIGGYVAFKVLIPIGLFFIAGFVMFRKESLRAFGIRMITIGLVLFLIVPSSVWVSGMVDKTHDLSKQQAIEEIGEETDLIEKDSEEAAAKDDAKEEMSAEDEDDSLIDKVKDSGTALLGKVKKEGSTALASMKTVPKKMNDLLDNLIEEVAYFFVSICVIPIIVLILLVILMKQLLGFSGAGGGNYSALIKEIKKLSLSKVEEAE